MIVDNEWTKIYCEDFNKEEAYDEIIKFQNREDIQPVLHFNKELNLWIRYKVESDE